MEYNMNEQINLEEENADRQTQMVPYDMELGYGYGTMPYEAQQASVQRDMDYETEYVTNQDTTPYESRQYNMPNAMYSQVSTACSMRPQSMYRQRDILPLLLLGLGAYGFNEYGGYNPYYAPYYPPYYAPYYPPYYQPYYWDYHHHRDNQ